MHPPNKQSLNHIYGLHCIILNMDHPNIMASHPIININLLHYELFVNLRSDVKFFSLICIAGLFEKMWH